MNVLNGEKGNILRNGITFSERKFDTTNLPEDVQRVYEHLKAKYGEEYALLFVFNMRTAIELHRAWHMTLLTSKILQQVKDKFGLCMTWDLGVIKLRIRVEDGGFELHRRVPYDYDSEYQDIYMRIAVALINGQINVHEALNFQTETRQGVHTAVSGKFLRDFPGRLVLYPLEAATCAVIFFGGDWKDAGIAALCGFVAGLIEYAMTSMEGDIRILMDITVGLSTGIIGGLFYRHLDGNCLPAIFLGTLYWFFYGTAFVIGLMEIIAGELETGVTRFIAVSVKTFVLSLGSALGLMLATSSTAAEDWFNSQQDHCGTTNIAEAWWRIPLYLLCSASALGQYRFPIVHYWRGLAVQLCAYEAQYKAFKYLDKRHERDNLDVSASNIFGAAAGVISACFISYISKQIRVFYIRRIYQTSDKDNSKTGNILFSFLITCIRFLACLRLGRKSDSNKLEMGGSLRNQRRELNDPTDPRQEIKLREKEESLILESIVEAQDLNVWSILMPALYQLVPGSIIAKLWYDSIFPPEYFASATRSAGVDSVFSNLMVISTSLALGLMIGFALVQGINYFFWNILYCGEISNQMKTGLSRMTGMYSAPMNKEDDPEAELDVQSSTDKDEINEDGFNENGFNENGLNEEEKMAEN